MVTLENNKLVFSFEHVHPKAVCEIDFQRTLRIPDDNKVYSLPPGLGNFPLVHTQDYADKIPEAWQKFGGVMLPMYQSEAMWIYFDSPQGYPFAVKIAAGKINAVTGKQWRNKLVGSPQDYLAIPDQPWLDGFHTSDNSVRQFVAMPLGEGFSAEEQLTGKAEFGGVQIIVYPMKAEIYEEMQAIQREKENSNVTLEFCEINYCSNMGLGAGGRIDQEIYEDENEVTDYDTNECSRCFVQLVNSEDWCSITGSKPPTKPFSASQYEQNGLPWFEYYSDKEVLPSGNILNKVKSVASKWLDDNGEPLEDNDSITTKKIVKISKDNITDGDW